MTDENEIPELNFDTMQSVSFEPVPENDWVDQKIVWYCRDCEKIVEGKQIGKTLKFICATCNGEKVSHGTEKSIYNYFNLKKEIE